MVTPHVITFISLIIILIDFIHQAKEEDHQKRQTDDVKVVLKIMGIRYSGQRPKGMVENCIGSQGPQYTGTLVEEKEEEE